MKRIIFKICIVCLILGTLGAIGAAGVVFLVSRDLPSYTKVSDYRPPQVTTIYARDGNIIGYLYEEKRFMVSLGQMPQYVYEAFVAAEDASFFEHDGISPKAILRAFIKNTLSGTTSEGGSTITQQVVKRILLTPEKSYTRKIKEAILSYRLESYLTKNEILNIYLNQIYLGSGAYGIESAARVYFGKHVEELALSEAAVLAGLPQSPSKVNPYANPEATKTRQLYVLGRMLKEGMISQEEHDQAVEEPLVYVSMPEPDKVGAWYIEEVERQLIRFLSEENVMDLQIPLERYGKDALYNAGLHIYTCMEIAHQDAAQTALRQGLLDTSKRHGWQGVEQHLETPEAIAAFIEKDAFTPAVLENAGWTKAVVTAVSKAKAEVRMGAFKGEIAAKQMEWCRKPNIKRAPEEPGQVRTPDQVLAVGDVVWVSAVGASGTLNPVGVPAGGKVKAYDASAVIADNPVALSLEQMPEVNGALVSMEVDSGDVVAIVGGYAPPPYTHYNRATRSKRQPGSSFKPIVYSAALDNGYTAASMINDAPIVSEYGTSTETNLWRPSNFDGVFYGPILLRTALVKSRNLCTIRLAQQIGIPAIIERARQLGIDGDIPVNLSISLGSHDVTPLTMTEAYTSFAGGGKRARPRFVQHIADSWGQTIVNFVPEKIDSISPENAYIMSSLLKDAVRFGTGARAKSLTRPIGGKTGTTNEERDAWFIGLNPYLVSTVYVGYDISRPMGKFETGSRVSVPIFTEYRKKIETLYPEDDFKAPDSITTVDIDDANGFLAGASTEKAVSLPFVAGTEPTMVSGAPRKRGDDDLGSAIDLFKQ